MSWFNFIWRQPGGLPECPYFRRTVLRIGNMSVRLHEWLSDDDTRHFHDHPHWFCTLVLWGGYTDVSEDGEDVLTMGSFRYRPAEYSHMVTKVKPGTLTLLITGPSMRKWGFWIKGKLIKRDKYFVVHGHHACDPLGDPVRLKPGGGRV